MSTSCCRWPPAGWTGSAGLLLIGSCVVGRPVLYSLVRRFFAGKPEMMAQWDARWRTHPGFRRHFVMLSAVMHFGTMAGLVGWLVWYRGRRQQATTRELSHAR